MADDEAQPVGEQAPDAAPDAAPAAEEAEAAPAAAEPEPESPAAPMPRANSSSRLSSSKSRPTTSEAPPAPAPSAEPSLNTAVKSIVSSALKMSIDLNTSTGGSKLVRELSTATSTPVDPLEVIVLDAVQAAADKAGFGDVASLCAQLRGPSGTVDIDAAAAVPPPSPGGEGSRARTPRVSLGGGHRDYLADGHIFHDETVLRLLRLLSEHRKAAEKEARYSEALAASAVIGRVQAGQERARLAEMRARHAAQRAEADAAHAADAAAHNGLWDAKAADYEALVAAQLEKLAQQHAAADAALAADLEARAPKRLQPSKELLELRSRMEALGRQGDYEAAVEAQKKAERAEAAEKATACDSFAAESARLLAAQAAKAAAERDAMLDRAARGRDQMRVARRHDAEQMVQRYRNVVATLEATHKKEATSLELFLSQQLLAGKRPGASATSAGASPGGARPPSPATSFNGKASGKASPLATQSGVAALRSATARKSAGAAARQAAAK